MKLHLIAIGGTVMHSLALALRQAGHGISGSDDVVEEPSRSRLAAAGLLPDALGWHPDRITTELDGVILGMHAKGDNPELARARELGLQVWSFPEFIADFSRHKHRVVIGGSHGKTTVTSLVIHALHSAGYHFDYLVGASIPGLPSQVRLSNDAPTIILEGDEYPASADDLRPKALVYDPHILALTGIAWDHINVYPTETEYLAVFERMLRELTKAGVVIFNKSDKRLRDLVKSTLVAERHYSIPYEALPSRIRGGQIRLRHEGKSYPTRMIGRHNRENIAAAMAVCQYLGLSPERFLSSLADFRGPDRRLQLLHQSERQVLIRDFAHAPSKVNAAVLAVRNHYRLSNLIAVLELHTFSSLDPAFLQQYRNALRKADYAIVLVDRQALARKGKGVALEDEMLRRAFNRKSLQIVSDAAELQRAVRASRTKKLLKKQDVILLMSSGAMAGLNPDELVG